jgi:sigma-E factor negative regulatory protein RseC
MDRLWQAATVVSASTGRVRVRFEPLSQCARCLRGDGCGAGVFAQLFTRRSTTVDLETRENWSPGQIVRVGVRAEALWQGALLLYGLPLLGFLLGAIVGQQISPGGVPADVSALLLGLVLAVSLARMSRSLRARRWNPVIEALSCDSCPDDA